MEFRKKQEKPSIMHFEMLQIVHLHCHSSSSQLFAEAGFG